MYEYIGKPLAGIEHQAYGPVQKEMKHPKAPQTPSVCDGISYPVCQMKASIQMEAQVFLCWGSRHPYSEL